MSSVVDPRPPDKMIDPAYAVSTLQIEDLAYLVAGDHRFAWIDDPALGNIMFRCPRCQVVGANGPTAELIDEWRWSCRQCHQTPRHLPNKLSTRFELERVVLEDAELLVAAYKLATRPSVDA